MSYSDRYRDSGRYTTRTYYVYGPRGSSRDNQTRENYPRTYQTRDYPTRYYSTREHQPRQNRDDRDWRNSYSNLRRVPDERRTQASTSGTYGTYIYPVDRMWYSNPDPALCYCNCCPHERPREASSRHAADPSARRPTQSRRAPGRIAIDVVDKTKGPLYTRHGRYFELSISRSATVRDVLAYLAPDRHRQKVLVRWRDDTTEPLDELVSMRELARVAVELVLKDRKAVHWH